MINHKNTETQRNAVAPQNGEHPAYGVARVTDVFGGCDLLGVPSLLNEYVRLEITQAKCYYDAHGVERIDGKDAPIISVAFSQAQWAAMLSSHGVYNGTPCTIQRLNGKGVPAILVERGTVQERRDAALKVMEQTIAEATKKMDEAMADLHTAIDNGKGKTVLREIMERVADAKRKIATSCPFMIETFADEMDKVTDAVQSEITAHASAVIGAGQYAEAMKHLGREAKDKPVFTLSRDTSRQDADPLDPA